MFCIVMLQFISRNVFSSPPVWTEDVARYMMVWTGLLGATLSFKTKADAVLMQSIFPPPPAFSELSVGWRAYHSRSGLHRAGGLVLFLKYPW